MLPTSSNDPLAVYGPAFQRALAAARAISERRFGLNRAARILPPFEPPSRPRATAAGFLARLTLPSSWAAALGLLGRLGIVQL
jgi:hypothetical protein